jgi:hypothetical protein
VKYEIFENGAGDTQPDMGADEIKRPVWKIRKDTTMTKTISIHH